MNQKTVAPRWLRLVAWLLGLPVVVVFGLLAMLVVPVVPDPTTGFAVRKGRLIAAEELSRTVVGESIVMESRLISSSGLELELAVRLPIGGLDTPRPLLVLLGGVGTGHRAVYVTKRSPNIVFAALSYPFRGDTDAKGVGFILQLPKTQRALLDTPSAVMLAMDFLEQQPYVDTQRVELVGGSLGAFLVSVPGALDQRFRRIWLIHGAGNPREVFEHRMQQYIDFKPLQKLAARLLAIFTASHHLRPEKWVGRISPRPVIVVNARDDEAYPASSVESLHEALGNPAEVIWTEGLHVTPGRIEVVEQLFDIVLERILGDQHIKFRSE